MPDDDETDRHYVDLIDCDWCGHATHGRKVKRKDGEVMVICTSCRRTLLDQL
jgi:transcription elongation factor Elf1